MALDLHRRAPLVTIAHEDANLGVTNAGIEELVAAPGVGGENGPQAVASAHRCISEAARRRRQHSRTATTVSLGPDAAAIDLAAGAENLPRRQHVIGAGGKGELRLVRDRGADAARAERVEHE